MQRWVALVAAGLTLLGLAAWWLHEPTAPEPAAERTQVASRRQPEKHLPRGPLPPISTTPASPEAVALVARFSAGELNGDPGLFERFARLGDAATLPLIDLLSRTDRRHNRSNRANCSSIVNVLGRIHDRRAVPKLLEIVDQPAPSADSKMSRSEDMRFDGCVDAAIEALGALGDPVAVPALIHKLRGVHGSTAAQSLGLIRDERAIDPLVEALAYGSLTFESVSRALRQFNETPLAKVQRALKNSDPVMRQMALRFLNEAARITSPEICVPLLVDPEPAVRREAIVAIGALRDASHSALVVPLLLDVDPDVRLTAAIELLHLGDRRGRDTLIAELPRKGEALLANGGEYRVDVDEFTIFDLLRIAGEAADARLIPWLGQIVTDERRSPGLREAAVESLSHMHDAAAAAPLVAVLSHWRISRAVGAALVNLKWKPRTIEERVHFLVAQRDGAALRAIGQDAKSVLVADLQSSDPRVFETAASALVGLGQTDFVDELIGVLEQKGTVKFAEALLNSNQPELEKAARAWADERGYSVFGGSGDHASWSSF